MRLNQIAQKQLLDFREILAQITAEDYASPLHLLDYTSISKHVRHIIEFYECIFQAQTMEYICYDERKRNLRFENELAYTLHHLEKLSVRIGDLPTDKQTTLKSVYADQEVFCITSLARELAYTIEHTIHHFAILRIAFVQVFPYVQLPEHFGYTDSTIQYNQNTQQDK